MNEYANPDHPAYAEWGAAYVLGALTPDDRRAFESHLHECEACRLSVAQLAPMPGLLSRARPIIAADEDVTAADGPPINLISLVERREARRRQTVRRRITVAVASVAAAVALAVAIPALTASDAALPIATVALEPVGNSPLTASVALTETTWGTSVSMVCDYPATASGPIYAADPTYSLVITDSSGVETQVSTWTATPGKTVTLDAGTATPVDQIATIEVRDAAGEPVLSAVA